MGCTVRVYAILPKIEVVSVTMANKMANSVPNTSSMMSRSWMDREIRFIWLSRTFYTRIDTTSSYVDISYE